MKVIFIIPSMTGGGAERVISVLANEFVENGIETKILMTAGKDCVYHLNDKIELFQAGERTGKSFAKRLQRIRKMRRYFKENRDAVLIAFEPDAAFFSCIAKAGLSQTLISSERNDPASFGNKGIRKFAYYFSKKIVFQTDEAREYFPQRIKRKGEIIENPISEKLVFPYTGKRKKTVISVGRFEKQKNHSLLIRAFARFTVKYPDYTLHLYGKGSLEKEIRDLSEKLAVKEKVILEGFQNDVMSKVTDAGMYVLSSDYEGISNSLLEAMAVGLPVISTDCPCGGARLCIQNGINGLLVPVGDEDALVHAMEEMAADSEKAMAMGREAAAVRETFSARNIAAKWISLLNELKEG